MVRVKEYCKGKLGLPLGAEHLVLLVLSSVLAVAILLSAPVTAGSSQKPTVKVNITADGAAWEYSSSQATIGALLKEAGIVLSAKDIVKPALSSRPANNMSVRVIRITEQVVTQRVPIGFKTITKFDPYAQNKKVIRAGQRGEKEVRYLVTYKDGVKAGYKVEAANVIKQPVNEIVSGSGRVFLASRSGSYYRCMTMVATAYDPGPRSCGKFADGYTANGTKAQKGVVAVDPRVIKLGTRLYVEGYGPCIAADTGGAIKGMRIDLCYNTYAEAIRFGRRTVKVYILN